MQSENSLSHTPLDELHRALGARMVPFAGYSMPVQYREGVLKEHQHTREQASLFDVSHMGQLRVRGAGAAEALERLLPVDLGKLPDQRQTYTLLLNEQGGIVDDLMLARRGDEFLLVLNAANKHRDVEYLRGGLPECELTLQEDRALLALQGPEARTVMERLCPELASLTFMNTGDFTVDGIACWVSCSGYTGEDGFELSVAAADAPRLAERLLAESEVAPAGLGARDSLRLEAGLCLHGHDLDAHTTPVSASLHWAIAKSRRPGGEREGGYPGAERIAEEWREGPARLRTLLAVEGRAPLREGVSVVDDDDREIGCITSGGFGPSVGAPVAMGYVERPWLSGERPMYGVLRGKRIPLSPRERPFITPRYFRG